LRPTENSATADAPSPPARPYRDLTGAPPPTGSSLASRADDLLAQETPTTAVSDRDLVDWNPRELELQLPKAVSSDPYDPALLGLSQDFVGETHVKKQWNTIRVERPSKERVFRVHPDPRFRLKTVLLELKEENETYLVLPKLRDALAAEGTCGVFTLLACVTKKGTPFLWHIRMAAADGRWNKWHNSAWQIAEKAMSCWTLMESSREAGHYVAKYDQRPPDQQQEPAWPDMAFSEWLRLAFQGNTIDSLDHPVLRRLRLED